MNTYQDNTIWNINEAANHLGMGPDRARKLIASNGITPVRTHEGVGYDSDDIRAITPRRRHHGDDA